MLVSVKFGCCSELWGEANFERRRKGQLFCFFFNCVGFMAVGGFEQLLLSREARSVCVGDNAQLLYGVNNK
jgi:hypothetical protein